MAFGIRRAARKEPLESGASVVVLARVEIGVTDLAPDFALAMIRVAADDRIEMSDGFTQAALLAADAAKLVMRVRLVLINLDGAREAALRFIQFAAPLMNQAEVVMRRRVCRVERGDFEMALELFAGALRADQVAEEVSKQQDEHDQQERRGQQSEQRARHKPHRNE